jgi:hypothetical protein
VKLGLTLRALIKFQLVFELIETNGAFETFLAKPLFVFGFLEFQTHAMEHQLTALAGLEG